MSAAKVKRNSEYGQDLTDAPQSIQFSNQVNKALEELLPSTDIFDSAHFDSVDYINQLFPNEQSLESVDTFLVKVKKRVSRVENEISYMVRKQSSAGAQAKKELEDTKNVIHSLYDKIQDIKKKSEQSEQMVQKITKDIRSLDYGKKNLGNTCEAIKKLQELVLNIQQLEIETEKKNYALVATLLTKANELRDRFMKYKNLKKVDDLFDKLVAVESKLEGKILKDFESWDKIKESNDLPEKLLAEACQVVDAIGDAFREKLIAKFVKQQLSLYEMIFSQKKKSGLDVVSKRFNWIRKLLVTYESKYAKIFPDYWCVREELVVEFCLETRQDITHILTTQRDILDATVLYRSILQTTNFEREMHDKFYVRSEAEAQKEVELKHDKIVEEIKELTANEAKTSDELKRLFSLRLKLRELERQAQQQKNLREVIDDKPKKKKPLNSYNFLGFISTAFDDHMDAYIKFEDTQLSEALEKMIRREHWDGEGETKSHEDLLMFITSSMKSCTAFSKGKVLIKLINNVWKPHISAYAAFMDRSIPRIHAANQKDGSFDLGRWIPNEARENTANTKTKLTVVEESAVCYMIHVAMFWQSNLEDLQEDLISTMEEAYTSQVDFSGEINAFYIVLKTAIEQLVFNLMAMIEEEFAKMLRAPLGTMMEVGDQSEYMHCMISLLSDAFPYLAERIPTTSYKTLCDNFTSSIYNSYMTHIYKCKKINGSGAQQLLLDVTSLTAFLKVILNLGDPMRFDEDEVLSFAKKVQQRASKVECVLKVLLAPPEALVETYKSLITNGSLQDLQAIMELQGLAKNERGAIIEEFNQKKKKSVIGATTGVLFGGVQDFSNKTKEISQQTNKVVADSFNKMKNLTNTLANF